MYKLKPGEGVLWKAQTAKLFSKIFIKQHPTIFSKICAKQMVTEVKSKPRKKKRKSD
jgi:hypothetical protein